MRDFKRTIGSTTFDVFNVFIMVVLCAITVYPFLFVVSRSIMPDAERAARPYALIPTTGVTIQGYTYMFGAGSRVIQGYLITIFRTVVGTILSVVCEAMFAYALSKKYYPLRGFLTVMIAITLWFGAGIIPRFLVVRMIGLYNSIWVFVLAPLMGAWGIIIMRTFFSQLPDSLEESAKLDGANDVRILFQIVFPLSTPVLATMALFSVVFHWNEWFSGIIYIADPKKVPIMVLLWQTLQQAAAQIRGDSRGADVNYVVPPTLTIKMSLIVITSFPIVIAYPFFQKYFVKGMLIGSIKG
jgi:putative aldouronate transport system permease protein